jgi:hypothetical protein
MTKIIFDNAAYRRSHGADPRGHGAWAFRVGRELMWKTGTLTEAKQQIRAALADRKGTIIVDVMP